VLLSKYTHIHTVVNKVEKLDNVFRTPELVLMAGAPSLETEVKEGKCKFFLDFGKVYWNSRQ